MISKVTEKNIDLINARMAEINAALEAEGSSTRISNLEEYYANIVEISKLKTNFGPTGAKAPYKFFLMPLDEPIFEIDANKRTIAVPQAFSKNGIGVRGDHKAEILYFKIDRYFDYKDLMNVDAIVINWQFRPANASRNAEFPITPSVALAPDETFDEGHIVFGWVITQDMTPSKGTLSFSVSFIMRTGDKYNYLLSTQVASVAVNDTIILEDPSALSDLRAPIFERLSNSRYTPESLTPLLDPYFRSGEPEEEDGESILRGLYPVANFSIDNEGEEQESLKLSAIGVAPGEGTIHYAWSWSTFDPEEAGEDDSDFISYVPTQDVAPIEGVNYYLVEEGNPELLEGDDIAAAFADPNITVYEAGTELSVSKAGNYLVSMQSSKTINQGLLDGEEESDRPDTIVLKSGRIDSRVCAIPHAAIPAVELSVSGLSPTQGAYEIYDEAQAEGYTFIEGNSTPVISAAISKDESKIYDVASGEGVKGVSADSEIGAIALKLTNAEGDSGKPQASEFDNMIFKVQDEKDGISYALTREGGIFPVDSASANGEGVYKVYAVNRRNHSYGVSDASNTLKVSAIAPQLANIKIEVLDIPDAVEEGQEQSYSDITLIANNIKSGEAKIEITSADASRDFALTIEDNLDNLADEVIIEPTLYEIDHIAYEQNNTIICLSDDEVSATEDVPNVYAMDVDPENPQRFTFTLNNDPGYFIAKVVTKYNGTKRISVTEPFRITS